MAEEAAVSIRVRLFFVEALVGGLPRGGEFRITGNPNSEADNVLRNDQSSSIWGAEIVGCTGTGLPVGTRVDVVESLDSFRSAEELQVVSTEVRTGFFTFNFFFFFVCWESGAVQLGLKCGYDTIQKF